MDAISSSSKIIYLFIFLFSLPVLSLLSSAAIWYYRRFKRFSFIMYILNVILTLVLLLGAADTLISRLAIENSIRQLYLWSLFFAISSIVLIIISIGLYRKNKKSSNILINISTLLCYIINVILLNTINI